ncbi:regulator of polyketide synthase expression [Mycobacteroides abscessus subsp. massiliense]|nr:regulator of polyketide synthase expression [Mycobacteroides abscessus subsp. massiliense]
MVAIESGPLDYRTLRSAEKALRDQGFASAWRVDPDMQVGIVALPTPSRLEELGETLRNLGVRRIGVSPVYDGYPPPGPPLNYAKAALLAATEDDPVVAFDANPYAVAAITDPQTMARYRDLVLGSLTEIGVVDRQLLVDTFRQWVDCDGSIPATARVLFCHPNTVRYRLRRLRQLTGRDVARPRDIAELHLAVEADRRLSWA